MSDKHFAKCKMSHLDAKLDGSAGWVYVRVEQSFKIHVLYTFLLRERLYPLASY